MSDLLTASLSNAALLLLLLCEYELVGVELALAAAACSLAVQTQGGLEVFFVLLQPQASVSANEHCVFKNLTSKLIKVGADGGGKVNCACSRA